MTITLGPVGAFEYPEFSQGTNAIIDLLASMTSEGVCTIVCGGDTVAAIEQKGLMNFTHVSTGGGAALEFLEGKTLPGIAVLDKLYTTNDITEFAEMDTTPIDPEQQEMKEGPEDNDYTTKTAAKKVLVVGDIEGKSSVTSSSTTSKSPGRGSNAHFAKSVTTTTTSPFKASSTGSIGVVTVPDSSDEDIVDADTDVSHSKGVTEMKRDILDTSSVSNTSSPIAYGTEEKKRKFP